MRKILLAGIVYATLYIAYALADERAAASGAGGVYSLQRGVISTRVRFDTPLQNRMRGSFARPG
jgi:hypothetical protein